MIKHYIQPLLAESNTHFSAVKLTGNVKVRALTLEITTKYREQRPARYCNTLEVIHKSDEVKGFEKKMKKTVPALHRHCSSVTLQIASVNRQAM